MVNLQTFQIETDLVPGPVEYAALLPKGYEKSDTNYPLLLFLHGGGGDMKFLTQRTGPLIWDMWERNTAPEMVVITPSCQRSFYINYKDGSQKWESFIMEELIPHLKKKFNVSDDYKKTFIGGVSMGGMGSLRMGLKYPQKFGGIISFEPGIEPAIEWKDIKPEDRFYRDLAFMEERFGSPIDENYWKANNPASILIKNREKIRNSGIKIYIEVGTEDMLGLFRGSEFLHRILFDNKIKHEYRLVYGADHVGNTFTERFNNGFSYLNRVINPPDPDSQVIATRKFFAVMKNKFNNT